MPSIDNWWPPREIKFTWEQVEWLLSHYPSLHEGQWPHQDKDDRKQPIGEPPRISKTKGRRRWGYFETPCEVAAELDIRMQIIGEDSSILRDIYILAITEEKAAKLRGITASTLHRRKVEAMKRMCGRDHKGPRCDDCDYWNGHCKMWSVECVNSLLKPLFSPREEDSEGA